MFEIYMIGLYCVFNGTELTLIYEDLIPGRLLPPIITDDPSIIQAL